MVVSFTNINGLKLNSNYSTNVFNYSNNNNNESIFNIKNTNAQNTDDIVKKDEANGFKPKDLLEVDKFFVPMLKAALGPAMTYLISECSFKKCDKDGNGVLTSDEYADLTTNFNFDLSGEKKVDNNENKDGNSVVKKILNLISEVGGSCSIMNIPGVKDVTEAFKNTLKMMIQFDTNNNGKIEKNEFNQMLDEKSTEQIPTEIKDEMFSGLSAKQTSGQDSLDLGSFTNFAFSSKLAWNPNKKINTQRVLSDFGKTSKTDKEDETKGEKKEAAMVI